MSKRARPRRGEWRPPRPRIEVFKASAAAAVILGLTAGIIYLWPTGSSGGNTPTTVSTSSPTTAKPATTTTKPGATATTKAPTATSAPATTGTSAPAGATATTKAGAAP